MRHHFPEFAVNVLHERASAALRSDWRKQVSGFARVKVMGYPMHPFGSEAACPRREGFEHMRTMCQRSDEKHGAAAETTTPKGLGGGTAGKPAGHKGFDGRPRGIAA
jgi:hypothetical protein